MKRTLFLLISLVGIALTLAGCSEKKPPVKKVKQTTVQSNEETKLKLTGVVVKLDKDENSIIINECENNTKAQYTYDVGCQITNRSNEAITLEQIHPGDVVDIKYDNNGKLLEMAISTNPDVWENTRVSSFSYTPAEQALTVGKSKYYCDNNIDVFSNDEIIRVTELCKEDLLIVRGYKTKIVSIVVDKGHGYLTLSGESLFLGGYVDVGNRVVKVIEKDMIVIVREGDYKVEVKNGAYNASKQVNIERDTKCNVDFSEIQPIVNEVGTLKINTDMDGVTVYIDGEIKDYREIQTLTVGMHTIKATAEGYADREFRVEIDRGHKEIDVSLATDETKSDAATTASEKNTTAGIEEVTTSGGTVSTVNKVTVSGPKGGFVYFDGTYKGTAPVTFPLVTGEHVISILDNNNIKSYTVNLREGGDDVDYDFTDK